ncbi:exo-alpha-sialidase [Rhodoferax aquaticus]|uniref:Sialidase domain-containing protein n=1 Tax=Rhodoferax aquaticus TaxID=2527691 RepID=A0A515ET32_9BURK|nr:sialidase family protein [Rhodoferax aquaticus]QDL55811.1 hypothetical protein EXZ61_17450 [Rhodoferax aquaticus]
MDVLKFHWRLLIAALAVSGLLAWDLAQRPVSPAEAATVWPDTTGVAQPMVLTKVDQGPVPMPAQSAAAHASTLLVMPADSAARLRIFWFSGERESGPNVQIATSEWRRADQAWSPPQWAVNRHVLGAQLGYGVRRLGNPVAWLDADARIHLFVVATGAGGWAASRIVHLRQTQASRAAGAVEFEPMPALPVSWLWNTSYLVRSSPLPLADGGMVLPVHFELGIKHPAALRFDRYGGLMGISRISGRGYALQPTLLAQGPREWTALMRDERAQGRVLAARTQDGGRSWQDLPDLSLINPDSSVAGLGLAPGFGVLVHNSSPGSRAVMDLSVSGNGQDWRLLNRMAEGAPDDEFSYPALAWEQGNLWVSYTVDRKTISWQRFSTNGADKAVTP